MSRLIVDARGRSCPEPVVMTKKAMDNNSDSVLEVLVDTKVALENVSRLAKGRGYLSEINKNDEEYIILLKK